MSDDDTTQDNIHHLYPSDVEPPCEGLPRDETMLQASEPKLKRARILDAAKDLITGDRDRQHGDAAYSFDSISRVWTWWLEGKLTKSLSPRDAAMMLDLMKTSRIKTGEHNLDDYIDKAGYTALAGELEGD